MRHRNRVLFSFGFQRLAPMLEKGNVWYVRHYECYYDEVNVLYLCGGEPTRMSQGNSHLVSLGTSRRWLDLLFAPWRLLRFVRSRGPGTLLTADVVFGWWISSLVRLVGHKLVLVPVCIPEDIYRDSGRSLSGLPIWLERFLSSLTYRMAHTVMMGRFAEAFVDWLSSNPLSKHKLLVVEMLADALPSPGFLVAASQIQPGRRKSGRKTLIYVGRLHREKMVADLIHMMAALVKLGVDSRQARLLLVGDGPDRAKLERMAQELGVLDAVEFAGSIANEDIPKVLAEADVFVSPLTGTSLREASLCSVPIVAYDRDWLSGLLRHEETALLVPSRDIAGMAVQVKRLLDDPDMAARIALASRTLAEKMWSREAVASSLTELDARLCQ